jgi:hypothetical protein
VSFVGRGVAAGIAFILAAGSGVVAAFIAAQPSWGLWVALAVLVILGGIMQGIASLSERHSRSRVLASGAAAVAVGGSARSVRTRASGTHVPPESTTENAEITASGPGSVSVGDNAEFIVTQQSDNDGGARPK